MPAKMVDVEKAKSEFQELLKLVSSGTVIVIVEDDIPVARLIPAGERVAGLHSGQIWISEDFDEPIQDEFWMGDEE
jgi:antitoxin (DNA-binding transcriptional repressor) of toxin-antitoxin stability system